MATLKLVPASGSPVEVDGDQAIVGRDPSCDVVVNDASVSRKHARVERWGGNWAVLDQRSANGTFLDGQRVAESILRAGQELRFGAVAYRVEIEADQTGATVLMSIPDATVLHQAAVTTPPPVRRPTPPTPMPAPPPVARPAAVPPPAVPSTPRVAHAPEPVAKGKGPWFWAALGCGGILLLALIGFGSILGIPFYTSRGAVDAARAQLAEVRAGNLDAAYARTAPSYQAAHGASAFAAFVARHPGLKGNTDSTFTSRSVENDRARLSGILSHAAGTESVVYELVKEDGGWKVSGIAVDGDEGAAAASSGDDGGGLVIETIAANKSSQGQTITIRIDVRVRGFDLRPEGNLFRVDLAEDLETIGPDGRRIEELSRVGLETFNQTMASATDATATFNTSLTFSKPDPGRYKAILTIRDLVGAKSKRHEVPFDLP